MPFKGKKKAMPRRPKFRRTFPKKIPGYLKDSVIPRGVARAEPHFYTTTETSQSSSTTGYVDLINDIQTGDAVSDREGNIIRMQYLRLNFIFYNQANFVYCRQPVRIIVCYDKQPIAVLPGIDAFFDTGTPTQYINAVKQTAYNKRFIYLADQTVDLTFDPANVATLAAQEQKVSMFINLKGLVAEYYSATGTISQILKGALYLAVVGPHAAGATASPMFIHTRTLKFEK